jgi:NAD(P)-dependent dehydrogenase (short-subunit alcohol dehydrogenase family)
MSPAAPAGSRLLVVGASSGIGRAVALGAANAGWRVVVGARRTDELDELRDATDGQIATMRTDVRRDPDCRNLVDRSVEILGGLDAYVYAAGTSPLSLLLDTDGDAWREVLETNVVGAAQTCRAAVPHLRASGGRAAFLSSIATDDPRPFLVAYGASKAALDALVRGWRNEHPDVCFIRMVVGPTATEFGSRWDPDTIADLNKVRVARGLVKATMMTTDEVAAQVLDALSAPIWVQDVTVMPRNSPAEHDNDRHVP